MVIARDKYIQRQTQQGGKVPESISKQIRQNTNFKTIDPEIPDFELKRSQMIKFAGSCFKSQYQRFFTLDRENFKYYEGATTQQVKNSMALKGADSFLQEYSTYFKDLKANKVDEKQKEDWTNPNLLFRVGISLTGREMKPVFFYTQNLHEAKFLEAKIKFYGNQYNAASMDTRIGLCQLIDKMTRFQKIIRAMVFAKEKRFVAMNQFQEVAMNLIDIAQQSIEYRKIVAQRWFTGVLDQDDKPVTRSAFRSANPKGFDIKKRQAIMVEQINERMNKLIAFGKNRKVYRQTQIQQEISRQLLVEQTGINVQSLQMVNYSNNLGDYETELQIVNNAASLILESFDNYRFMIIENKTIEVAQNQNRQTTQIMNQKRQKQAQNLLRKVDLGQVSFLSTNLDQTTQFDYYNKLNKQNSYKIRIYGPILKINDPTINQDKVPIVPVQLGLDAIRMANANFKLQITGIKYPPALAQNVSEKITFMLKLNQFYNINDISQIYETHSQIVKIKGYSAGQIYPTEQNNEDGESCVFKFNKLCEGKNEGFSIGLTIRMNEKPVTLCTERFLEQEELQSHFQKQIFKYDNFNREQSVIMKDFTGAQFEIRFIIQKIQQEISGKIQLEVPHEKIGKRALVGRFVLFEGRPAQLRAVYGNGQCEITETITKIERKIALKECTLLETFGVNIFKLQEEPELINKSIFQWIIDIQTDDKRLLNQIHSKIQIQQAYQAYKNQDKKFSDPYDSIQGLMRVALIEAKGLILPEEINSKNIDRNKKIKPIVQILLENDAGQVLAEFKTKNDQECRELSWGGTNLNKNTNQLITLSDEFIVTLNDINHSGDVEGEQVVIKQDMERRLTRTLTKTKGFGAVNKKNLHLVVLNGIDGQQIGDARVQIDELIDIKFKDLAKEYCVPLNRHHLLKQQESKLTNNPDALKKLQLATQFSGIIRFQTQFVPTKDTCLRFELLRQNQILSTPQQMLHFEYLMQKSDQDGYKFRVPKLEFRPNIRSFGLDQINLDLLIEQCKNEPKIRDIIISLQSMIENKKETSLSQARASLSGAKISKELVDQMNKKLKFQSPFEKLYILLKLQRKERPMVESIFWTFRNTWSIYIQQVKNGAFDRLTLNEWIAFIEELSGKHNFKEMEQIFGQNQDFDDSQDLTNRSFIGEMVKTMNQKAQDMQRQSQLYASQIETGAQAKTQNYSLVLNQEWAKENSQTWNDLVSLIRSGIPAQLRTVVWSDLLKTNLLELDAKKHLIKYLHISYRKDLSVFGNLSELTNKYSCVAFRQIDQDIQDFKFPRGYWESETNQGQQFGTSQSEQFKVDQQLSRSNKLKQDKQKMRKLLRVLVVWGKTFKYKGESMQFCYPSGFLYVALRLINLMRVEEAFWIVVGIVNQYPRLWCLTESSMLDDAKSLFRFELTSIRSILEANFPSVSKKLYELGVPIEQVVYDSMTSLYSSLFNSEILLRIWDQMFFYINMNDAKSRRKGIWMILAPALLVIAKQQDQILKCQTPEQVIQAYNDGCAIDYNPNHIIQMINDIIDDIFVTENKQAEKFAEGLQTPMVESGGTGISAIAKGQKDQGFLDGLISRFTGTSQVITQSISKVDEVRREYNRMQNLIYEEQRAKNKIIQQFLYKNQEKNEQKPKIKSKVSQDDMDFDGENSIDNSDKPSSHTHLDYAQWRTMILPEIKASVLNQTNIEEGDLHQREDTEIFTKTTLDIKLIHIFLHCLDNWYGTGEDGQDDRFQIQIQYGRLHSSGKFEVKNYTKEDSELFKSDPNLQYFTNFKYSSNYNHLKVKIMTAKGEKVCHCYVDLRGQNRGQFVYITKAMNAKEYTTSPESNFAVTHLKMSLFLENKKVETELERATSDDEIRESIFSSLRKRECGFVNIYQSEKEIYFQQKMFPHLQKQVDEDFGNFKQYLQNDNVIDLIMNKYYNVTLKPPEKHANLTPSIFKDFVERCFPRFYQSVQYSEIIQIYRDLQRANHLAAIARDNSKKLTSSVQTTTPYSEQLEKLRNKIAELDTQQRKIDAGDDLRKEVASSDFSLRSFVYGVLFQSPLTVIEKLDIIFDIGELCNKFIDGIDSNEALSLCESVLKQHQYFLPTNELRTLIETVFNKNGPANIFGAFWTSKSLSEIKYDLERTEENGCFKFETFLNSESNNKKVDVVDITKEVQATFAMYQNLYGNKVIDFNSDSSPFFDLNSFFISQQKGDLGNLLLQKTKTMEWGNRFRLCLVSKIGNGERTTLELKYSLETGLLMNSDLPDEKNKFKKIFMRNINILDLTSKSGAVGKFEFFQAAQKIPFVYDLLRAETFWQDRQLENTLGDDFKNKLNQKLNKKPISLKMKQKLQSIVTVYVSDKDKIFIFKFENKTIPSGKQGAPKELSGQMYLFEMDSLFLEDIIMDMRDRILNELQCLDPSKFNLSPNLISEIEGKMEFYVRKIGQQSASNIQWLWRSVNDFERIEKFSDDEVFEDEVIFKLIISNAFNEEIMDETPQHITDGYDCFSIYKHSDNSYEWRLCKIMGKELRPEFKTAQQVIEKFTSRIENTSQRSLVGNLSQVGVGKKFQNEQEQFFYFLEFEHLRDQGKEMWVKRRREDIIFSANQARDLPNFEMNCYKYILETYMSKKRQ